jgi:hypothetical protein
MADYNGRMALSGADIRRWLHGFEEADRAARLARQREGPDPQRSIALSLSLLDAVLTATGGRYPDDPRRAEMDQAVRITWDRLRTHFLR